MDENDGVKASLKTAYNNNKNSGLKICHAKKWNINLKVNTLFPFYMQRAEREQGKRNMKYQRQNNKLL